MSLVAGSARVQWKQSVGKLNNCLGRLVRPEIDGELLGVEGLVVSLAIVCSVIRQLVTQ